MTIKPEISRAQRKIINGIYVISTRLGERINAMTAAWVCRASHSPPLLTVAIGRTRYTHDMIRGSGVFAVHALGPEHMGVAKRFGLKTGHRSKKFEGVEYSTKVTGSPILRDCIAWIDCRVVGEHDAGDHTIFVGEMLDGDVVKDVPTVLYDRESFYMAR